MSEASEKIPLGTQMVAQPKLRKVDTLMVSVSDKEFIDAKVKEGLIRGGVVGAVAAVASTAMLSRRIPIPAAALTGLASGLLCGLFGAATTVPNVLRETVLFLPNDSPLKMSVFHVYVSDHSPTEIRAQTTCNCPDSQPHALFRPSLPLQRAANEP